MRTLVLIVLLMWPRLGEAHRFHVERALFIEPSRDGAVHIVASIKIPRDGRASALTLAGGQSSELKRQLIVRALDGVHIEANGKKLELANTSAKLLNQPGAPIELMVHGSAEVSTSTVTFSVSASSSAEPVTVTVLAHDRRVVSPSRGAVKDGALTVALRKSDALAWHAAPAPSSR